MGYFPMCVNLAGRRVCLVGDGPQIREKAERLAPFGAQLVHLKALTPQDLADKPVFVIAGDLDAQEAERTAALCAAHGVMINVVDQPRLCTFAFPSLIARGDLTVSVSTAGKAPGAAAYLRECIERQLPADTEGILEWLAQVRLGLMRDYAPAQRARLMRRITAAAFEKGVLLDDQNLQRILCDAQPCASEKE